MDRVISLPATMQDGIDAVVEQFNRSIDATLSTMSGPDRDDYAEMAQAHSEELSEEYPLLMRRALLMVTYSKLEHSLHRLRKAAYRDKPLISSKPKEQYPGPSETEIKGMLGIKDAELETGWNFVNGLRDIRDILVHSDGNIQDDRRAEAIRTFLGAYPAYEITIDEYDYLVLGGNSVELIASRIREFIESLLHRIRALPCQVVDQNRTC